MEWFIAVIAVAALGVAAMAAAGGMGEMNREPVYDTYRQDLPDRLLTAEDVRRLRFGIALRGYAMGQVDDVLERLATEVAERDARIAELTAAAAPKSAPTAGQQQLPPEQQLPAPEPELPIAERWLSAAEPDPPDAREPDRRLSRTPTAPEAGGLDGSQPHRTPADGS